jgi:hypothetical protein
LPPIDQLVPTGETWTAELVVRIIGARPGRPHPVITTEETVSVFVGPDYIDRRMSLTRGRFPESHGVGILDIGYLGSCDRPKPHVCKSVEAAPGRYPDLAGNAENGSRPIAPRQRTCQSTDDGETHAPIGTHIQGGAGEPIEDARVHPVRTDEGPIGQSRRIVPVVPGKGGIHRVTVRERPKDRRTVGVHRDEPVVTGGGITVRVGTETDPTLTVVGGITACRSPPYTVAFPHHDGGGELGVIDAVRRAHRRVAIHPKRG